MSPEIFEYADPPQSRILRIDSPESVVFLARTDLSFDGIKVGAEMPDFTALAPHADRVKWICSCQARSPAGLEALQSLARLQFLGSDEGLRFDYRLLKGLKSFECDSAEKIPAEFLNSSSIESLNIASGKIESLSPLTGMTNLRQLRLSNCQVKALAGVEALRNLREMRLHLAGRLTDIGALAGCQDITALEIKDARKLSDVSVIKVLKNLRILFIDAPNAALEDIHWLSDMPDLRCAGIYVRAREIDWDVVGRHPQLYDVVLHAAKGGLQESDAEITARLQSAGRKVRRLTRFKAVPAIRIELEPPAVMQKNVKSLLYYENYLGHVPVL